MKWNKLQEYEVKEDFFLAGDLSELVCKFNHNKPIMKYFTGKLKAYKVDIEKYYP